MKSGIAVGALVMGFAVAGGCGTNREFGTGGAGASGEGGSNHAGSGNSAGKAGTAGRAGAEVNAGAAGMAGSEADAGAAGMAGAPDEPADPCIGKVCNTPPSADCLSGTQFQSYDQVGSCEAGECRYESHTIACTCTGQSCTSDPCANLTCTAPPVATCKDNNTRTTYAASGTCNAGSCSYTPTDSACAFGCAAGACKADPCAGVSCTTPPAPACKDANTRTTYAASGACSAGTCNYAATNTACSGDTPKCKSTTTASQCVTCVANADCSNGGTCSANACVCSARFNGKRCEFQVFRGLGTLLNDNASSATNISRDGSVVIGSSSYNGVPHAFRSVDGGALQYIANPTGATGDCLAVSVDASGTVLLSCGNGSFLYAPNGVATAVSAPTGGSYADFSSDAKVLVGSAGTQALRRAASANSLFGPFQPGGSSYLAATNGDGSIAVGRHLNSPVNSPIRWTAATGLVALPLPSTWFATAATDVSTDGKVVVGWASLESEILTGQVAVKWSGASFTATAIGTAAAQGRASAVNFDGSVIVGSQGYPNVAMVWDGAGPHTIKSLLGATPDLDSGWTLESAVGVSDDGKFVVGTGTHGTNSEAWVAHLP